MTRYLGIDYGQARIGLAVANSIARLPAAHAVLPNDQQIFTKLQQIINQEKIDKLIIGLPRDMHGRETEQSAHTRQFAAQLAKQIDKPLEFADESLSSVRAEQNQNHKKTTAEHQDDVAACYILEEYLEVSGK